MSEPMQSIVVYTEEGKKDEIRQTDLYIELMTTLYLFGNKSYNIYIDALTRIYRNTEAIKEYIEIHVERERKNNNVIWNFNKRDLDEIQIMINNIETILFLALIEIQESNNNYKDLVENIKLIINNYDFKYYTCDAYNEWKERYDEMRLFNRINMQRTLYEKHLKYTNNVKKISPQTKKKPWWRWEFDLFGNSLDSIEF